MKKIIFAVLLSLFFFSSKTSFAAVSVTGASASVCLNYAVTGPAARWTTLGTMKLTEGSSSNMGNVTGAWSITITLAAPTGWQFNSAVNPTLSFTAARNVTSVTQSSISSSAYTFVINGTNKTLKDVVNIAGLQVQPLTTSSVSGSIKPSSITGTISGVSTSTTFSTLTATSPSAGTASVSIAASPSGAICAGTSVTFTASPTNGGTPLYQWKKGGVNISGATNSTYTSTSFANGDAITCSIISSSCITTATATSATTTMTVNAVPNVTNYSGTSATSPCIGSGSVLTVNSTSLGSGSFTAHFNLSGANTGSGYTNTLTMSGTSGSLPVPSSILTSSGATTITVTSLTNSGGCSSTVASSNAAAITVNALPTTVSASGAGTFCGSTTITADNGGSGTIYYQGTTSGGTSTATPSVSQSVSTSGTYYFNAQSSAGCWGTQGSVTVSVNPLPTTVVASGGGAFCGSTTITAANGGSGTIYYQGTTSGGTSTATPSASQSVSASGTYYFRAQSAAGCWSTEGSVTVTINPLPAAITGTASVCIGANTTLSNVTAGGSWSSSNSLIASVGSASGTVLGVAAGTATITYTLPTGCIATTTVTVLTTPASITGLSAVCSGSTISLGNTTLNGTWSSSNSGVASVGSASGVVTGVSNGSVTITYSTGCGSDATASVSVGNSPITGTLAVCSGSTTTLANAIAGGIWSSSSIGIASIGSSSGIVTGNSSGTATISYAQGGCTSTAVVTVNVNPGSISGTARACIGLSSSLSDGTPYGTWSSSNTATATVGSTGIVTGVAAGTVTITYATGCVPVATKSFTVNPLPAVIAGSGTVCLSATTTLTDATGGGTWSSASSGIASVGTGGVVTGASAGNTTITYTLATGCLTTSGITVNPLPASITGSTVICNGLTSTLSDATGSGTWSSSSSAVASVGSASGLVTGASAGTATITYSLPTGCIATTPVTINPLPSAITGTASVCVGATTTLSNSGGGTWTSSSPFVATIGSASGIVSGLVANNATITYTLSTGCLITKVVTINPLPSAISGTTSVCISATTNLTNAGGGTWSSSNALLASVGASSGIVSGVAVGTPTITYTLPTGCITTTTITVNPLPDAGTITGTTIFCDGTISVLSDGVSGGSWSSSDISIALVDAFGDVTGNSGGVANISYSYTNSCGTAYTFTGVTVNPLPDAGTITGATSVCAGSITSLSNWSTSGSWSTSDAAVATVDVSGNVTGVASGTVDISYISVNGCGIDFDAFTMTVNPLPSAISGTRHVCIGGTTTLSDAGGGAWSSNNTLVATIGTGTGVVSGIAAGTATITYTLSTGCEITATVTVNALPVVGVGSALPICTGTSTPLISASGAISYSWSPATGLSATTGSGVIASPLATTSYTVTGTDLNGCANTASVTVTVNPLPVINAGSSVAICNGSSTGLTATGGVSYTWSPATGLSAVTGASITANPSSTTTYTATGFSSSGCINTATVTVSVNALPVISVGSGVAICNGSSTLLSATGGVSYTWSPASGLSATTGASVTASPSSTKVYTVTGTNASGCSNTATVTVTVNALPIVSVGSALPICTGTSTPMISASGAISYSWSPATGLSATTGVGVFANPVSTTNYTVTGTDLNGCSNTASVTVSVNPLPVISAGSSVAICNGLNTVLSASGGVSYNWLPSTGLSATTGSSVTAGPATTTTYTISGTSSSGCINTTSVTVTVNSLPAITSISNNGPICAGVALNLSSTVSGGSGSYNYSWSGPNSFSSTSNNPSLSGATTAAAGTYTLTVTDTHSCIATGSNTTATIIIASPVISAIGNSGPICSGNTLSLNSTVTGGTGSLNYSWSGPNSFTASISSPLISSATTAATGVYTLSVTDANGCAATGANTTTATVNPNPVVLPITGANGVCVGNTTTLADATAGGVWSSSSSIATVDSTSGVVTGVSVSSVNISYSVTNVYSCTSYVTKNMDVETAVGFINTFAGTGVSGYSGDGGPAYLAKLSGPRGVATDTIGNIYITCLPNGVVRKIDVNGIITTVAGNGTVGMSGSGGPATAAQLNMTGGGGLFVDKAGNIYITCTGSSRICKVDASTGIINTIAGTGTAGYSGDGGPATAAQLNGPLGLCLDGSGNVYIADGTNFRIRKIDGSTGIISTIVGLGSNAYSGDGGPGSAARISYSRDVTLDNSGNLYIVDGSNNVIRKYVLSTGIITTIAGTGIAGGTGDGGTATAARLNSPAKITFDGVNGIYVSDMNHKIRKIDLTTGIISTMAGTGVTGFSGDGGPAVSAKLWGPAGLAFDKNGYLHIVDANNLRIRSTPPSGVLNITLAGSTTVPSGTPVTFTAYSSVRNDEISYQWRINGSNVAGATSSTYTNSTPVNGDVYTCLLIYAPHCNTGYTDTSNSISLIVYGPPSVEPSLIQDPAISHNVKVFPNPVHGILNIAGTDFAEGNATATITDQLGRVVMTRSFTISGGNVNEQIDMQSLPDGLYIVTITDNDGKSALVKCMKN